MKDLGIFLLVVGLTIGSMVWMSTHTWSCQPDQKGQLRTDPSKLITRCDGEHWVPYVVEDKR